MKIATNEIILKFEGDLDHLRGKLAEAEAAGDSRAARDYVRQIDVLRAAELGGVEVRVYKRCTVQYGYEGLEGWFRTPWAAALAYLEEYDK